MTPSPTTPADDLVRERAEQAQQRLSEHRYSREIPPAGKPYSSSAILIYGLVLSVLAHVFFLAMSRPANEPQKGQPVLLTALAPKAANAESLPRVKHDLGSLMPPVAAKAAPPKPATVLKAAKPSKPTVRPAPKKSPKAALKKSTPSKAKQKSKAVLKPKLVTSPKVSRQGPAKVETTPRPGDSAPPGTLKLANVATSAPPPATLPDSPPAPPAVRISIRETRDSLPEVSAPVSRAKPELLVKLPNPEGVAQNLRPSELAKMTALLADRLIYPLAAIEQGLEGQVMVQLALRQDGSIFTARVLESSGHLTLDRAAIQATRQLPPMPAYAGGEVVLPVTFKLR